LGQSISGVHHSAALGEEPSADLFTWPAPWGRNGSMPVPGEVTWRKRSESASCCDGARRRSAGVVTAIGRCVLCVPRPTLARMARGGVIPPGGSLWRREDHGGRAGAFRRKTVPERGPNPGGCFDIWRGEESSPPALDLQSALRDNLDPLSLRVGRSTRADGADLITDLSCREDALTINAGRQLRPADCVNGSTMR
jgi:hypothetical protein